MNNQEYQDFSYLTAPLDGFNLLEAAAGTGKTYTIQNLVVRLVIEENIPIENILITTYTNAAAAELKTRIRKNFTDLQREIDQLDHHDLSAQLLKRFADCGMEAKLIRQRILQTLANFDRSSICTIHSFAHRVLSDYSFESKFRFEPSLNANDNELISRLLSDFYRQVIYQSQQGALRRGLAINLRKNLSQKFQQIEHHPDLKWQEPPIPKGINTLDDYFRQLDTALTAVINCEEQNGGISALVGEFNRLTPAWYNKVQPLWANYKADPPQLSADLLEKLAALSSTALAKNIPVAATKNPEKLQKKQELLNSEAVQYCTLISQLRDCFTAVAYHEAEKWIQPRRAEFHQLENSTTFNAIIQQLRQALQGSNNPLVALLKKKYQVGVIDEFQDTDEAQYEIFRRIFIDSPSGTIFLVGDPRQAIYSFRGGDLNTYFSARQELQKLHGRVYTLRTNFRSAKTLVNALNKLYNHPCPFGIPDLGLPEQLAGADNSALLWDDQELSNPLQFIDCEEIAEVNKRCAEVIELMLKSQRYKLPAHGDQPAHLLAPSDIAVLVKSWKEADEIAQELHRRQISAVVLNSQNVFSSPEAWEFYQVLQAIANPTYDDAVITAAATPLLNYSIAELAKMKEEPNSPLLEELQNKIQQLNNTWQEKSFIAMFNLLLEVFSVSKKYASQSGAERKLTNLFQLADLLHEFDRTGFRTPVAMLLYFKLQIEQSENNSSDKFKQLRETDHPAVIINSIHGSKGLEYPVVFLPSLNKTVYTNNSYCYHDEQKLCSDLRDNQDKDFRITLELEQELLRDAYVALTRGSCATFILRTPRGKRFTPLAWLLADTPIPDNMSTLSVMLSKSPLRQDLSQGWQFQAPEVLEFPQVPPADAAYYQQFKANEFNDSNLWKNDRFVSFSSWVDNPVGGEGNIFTSAQDDESEEEDEEDASRDDSDETGKNGSTTPLNLEQFPILQLKGGTEFGTAVHHIFEVADFAAPAEKIQELTDKVMYRHGITNTAHLKLVREMIEKTLHTPLDNGTESWTLSEIDSAQRLPEVEFDYQFKKHFTAQNLFNTVSEYIKRKFHVTALELNKKQTIPGGFMQGFIDLLFERNGKYYIIDWKTNKLNGEISNFTPENLPIAMGKHKYFLQYLIYLVALLRLLRYQNPNFDRTDYEAKIGGVFYIFTRGVAAAPGHGIFFDRPDYDLMTKLEEIIG